MYHNSIRKLQKKKKNLNIMKHENCTHNILFFVINIVIALNTIILYTTTILLLCYYCIKILKL